MAFIKKDQEDQQSSLNTLGEQGANQPQQAASDSQGGALSQSTSQGATIGQTGQQSPQQQPSGTSKRASSGMFSNIRKYIDRNRPGAQRMGSNLSQRFQKRAGDVGQAIQKQKTDFMSRVDANRQRMQQAQDFGQETVQRATQLESQPMLQQQASDIQGRIDQFQPMQDQGYLEDIQQTQQQIAATQPGLEQAQVALQEAQQLERERQAEYDRLQTDLYGRTNTHIGQQFTDTGGQTRQTQTQEDLDYYLDQQIQGQLGNNSFSGDPRAQLIQDYERYQQLQQELPQTTQAQEQELEARQAEVGNLQGQLQEYQELDRLYQNRNQLQSELAVLQDKIDNAPEELTDAEIQRFNNLRTGVERFDQAILNVTQQARQTDELVRQAEEASTAQGRLALLREAFGQRGDYTRGESALDNLLISSDPETRNQLLQSLQQGSQDLRTTLRDAQRTGLVEQDRMRQSQEALQKLLGEEVTTAETGLTESLEERVQTGEGTYVKQLADALASGQGLSEDQLQMLGLTGQEIFNVDPTTLLQQYDPSQYSIQDVATSTDVARAQALARLGGQQDQTMFSDVDAIQRRYQQEEADMATLMLDELSDADRASVMKFKQDLRDNLKFTSVNDARNSIINETKQLHGGEFARNAEDIQQLVETGFSPVEGGVRMEDILNAGSQQELIAAMRPIQRAATIENQGREPNWGAVYNAIMNAYFKTQAMTEAVSSAWTPGQAGQQGYVFDNPNRLASESATFQDRTNAQSIGKYDSPNN